MCDTGSNAAPQDSGEGTENVATPTKEHRVVFGLTDHEVSVLQGALQDRAANESNDGLTCQGLEAILLDQLGREDGRGGWEILKGGSMSHYRIVEETRGEVTWTEDHDDSLAGACEAMLEHFGGEAGMPGDTVDELTDHMEEHRSIRIDMGEGCIVRLVEVV